MPDGNELRVTPMRASASTTARLNIRLSAPDLASPVKRTAALGETLHITGRCAGQDVAGNDVWYQLEEGGFAWSGATASLRLRALAGASPAAETVPDTTSETSPETPAPVEEMDVDRRADGTIRPLRDDDLRAVYGDLKTKSETNGRVTFLDDWPQDNLVDLATPLFASHGVSKISVHKRVKPAFERVFQRIEAAGLGHLVLTYDGGWVARHKGWNTNRNLSSHSWGVAIDINARWNPYGAAPAERGAHGSVWKLLPFFAEEGFAWGGHFQPVDKWGDGMHFEYARRDPA